MSEAARVKNHGQMQVFCRKQEGLDDHEGLEGGNSPEIPPRSSLERPRRVTSVSILGMPTCPQNSAGFKFHSLQLPCRNVQKMINVTSQAEEGDCSSKDFSVQTLHSWGKGGMLNYAIYFCFGTEINTGQCRYPKEPDILPITLQSTGEIGWNDS